MSHLAGPFCLSVCYLKQSLCSSGYPGQLCVSGWSKLRNLPAFASWVLGLEVCATVPGLGPQFPYFLKNINVNNLSLMGHIMTLWKYTQY